MGEGATREDWQRWRDRWQPFGPHSERDCQRPGCWDEALIEGGVRIAFCDQHLPEIESMTELAPRSELVVRVPVVDSRDLSLKQRAWSPSADDMGEWLTEWPHADRVEVWDGVMMFENRWQSPWTWRSVAIAARAYPDRRVRLVNNYVQVPMDPDPRDGDV